MAARITDTTNTDTFTTTTDITPMLIEQTRERLRTLKLTGMLDALERQIEQPDAHDLSFEQRLGLLVEHESLHRENRRLARLLMMAKLRTSACIEDIDYTHPRGLDKSKMASLAQLGWIRSGMNLCMTGRTGCGKTWLACAFGNQACRGGLSTRYFRLPRLLEALRISRGDGTYARLLAQLQKTDLLILDDWGSVPLDTAQRQDLMEIIEDRHGSRSTLIASQLPVAKWHTWIGEATLADAILDRLIHGSHRLPLKGGSMRKARAEAAGEADAGLTEDDRTE